MSNIKCLSVDDPYYKFVDAIKSYVSVREFVHTEQVWESCLKSANDNEYTLNVAQRVSLILKGNLGMVATRSRPHLDGKRPRLFQHPDREGVDKASVMRRFQISAREMLIHFPEHRKAIEGIFGDANSYEDLF